ncbi:FecR family protein [Pedobacter nyackensis]|uniref:FecR family protein n=1 Tax=Pedobacter nyackensis TaxID=475255 RepID=UPI00292DFD67|nr:FecR domain-containing protein [Pedobacter nyackensis]
MENIAEDLLNRYALGECSAEEQLIVEAFFVADLKKNYEDVSAQELEAAYQHISSNVNMHISADRKISRIGLWFRYAGIAAAVTAIVFGIWFFNYHNKGILKQQNDVVVNDIAPGKNSATLSINGKLIQLSDTKTGVVIDASKVTYNDSSALSDLRQILSDGKSRMVTATTPRGGTYQFILQDGTKVWLNADSKLEFLPDYKNQKQRIVRLEGEGYFEVAKDKKRSFIVESAGQKVEVLGTHFNINSYPDEANVKTTLLEGSVRISSNAEKNILLKPNEQAVVAGNHEIIVNQVIPEEVIAWKNGDFVFDHEDFESIIRKVEKWYNVEFIYSKGRYSQLKMNGSVSRSKNISSVLEALQQAGGLTFKREGRRIMVM